MDVRREVTTAFGALIVILLLVSLGAVGLFGRMSPVIERILQENDSSLRAVEQMEAVLALTSASPARADTSALRASFAAALADARRNVTEPEEGAQVEAIAARAPAALAGDPTAVSAAVDALQRLAAINRAAMVRVDHEAKRLGTAGAWSAVFLGLLGFSVGLFVLARVRSRLLDPLVHLRTVLGGVMGGDRNRRCTADAASPDVAYVMRVVNELLDKYERAGVMTDRDLEHCHASQTVLAHFLDRETGPQVVVDGDGGVICANQAALDVLSGSTGAEVKARLVSAASGDSTDGIQTVERFPDADCALYTIEAA